MCKIALRVRCRMPNLSICAIVHGIVSEIAYCLTAQVPMVFHIILPMLIWAARNNTSCASTPRFACPCPRRKNYLARSCEDNKYAHGRSSACLRRKQRPIEKKTARGFVLLTSRSGFPGLWPNPKGPTKCFRLILSRSKVMTSF